MRKILLTRTGKGMYFPMRLLLSSCCRLLFFHVVIGQERKTGNTPLHLVLANRPVREAFQSGEEQTGLPRHCGKTAGRASSVVINLEENKKGVGEVVVTALGIQRQSKELGYSTAKVSGATLNQAKTTNGASGLYGKVSGLQINTADNSVDPSSRIVLRGNRSFLGNNQALLIVDRAQLHLTYINYINPNDIDNLTALQGANAAA